MFTIASLAAHRDPIHIYTDGSYSAKLKAPSYGWVTMDAPAAFPSARAVNAPMPKCPVTMSCLMESAAIVDAIAEFAPLGRKLLIHADNQALMHLIDRYRAGEIGMETFLDNTTVLRPEDAKKLFRFIDSVDFELVWVKGHRADFLNLVVDQMLRISSLEGQGEAAGVAFAEEAMSTGTAIVRASICGPTGYYTGLGRVYLGTERVFALAA